jgi:hypothetical protein
LTEVQVANSSAALIEPAPVFAATLNEPAPEPMLTDIQVHVTAKSIPIKPTAIEDLSVHLIKKLLVQNLEDGPYPELMQLSKSL